MICSTKSNVRLLINRDELPKLRSYATLTRFTLHSVGRAAFRRRPTNDVKRLERRTVGSFRRSSSRRERYKHYQHPSASLRSFLLRRLPGDHSNRHHYQPTPSCYIFYAVYEAFDVRLTTGSCCPRAARLSTPRVFQAPAGARSQFSSITVGRLRVQWTRTRGS